jgi:hypothetical protein
MRKDRYAIITVALVIASSAVAGEQTFAISCARTLQAPFDAAVAEMARDQAKAHEMFHALAQKDEYCAAFHWGLARTTADPVTIRLHRRDAYLAAAEAAASPLEWQKLSELPQ